MLGTAHEEAAPLLGRLQATSKKSSLPVSARECAARAVIDAEWAAHNRRGEADHASTSINDLRIVSSCDT